MKSSIATINMRTCKLDNYTSWKSLPWTKINERIFLFQKKVYRASKTCKYIDLYIAQNTLLNCSEAKILAIQKVFKTLSQYSDQDNQKKYNFNDKDKFFIFINLFQSQELSKVFRVLVEKVKQYLIYLCIQPEWEARFEPVLQSNIKGTGAYLFQEKIIDFLHYYQDIHKLKYSIYLNYEITNKYIHTVYIINKIQSSSYINYCINFWLNNQCIEEFNGINLAESFIITLRFNILHQLLHKIICNGIEWFYAMTIELRLIRKQYNLCKCSNSFYEVSANYWIFINNDFQNHLVFVLKFLGLNMHKSNIYYAKYQYNYFNMPFCFRYKSLVNYEKYTSALQFSRIETTIDSYKPLFRIIKYLLYKKDVINRLRVNKNINISQSLLTINQSFLQFYKNYYLLLPLSIVKKIYKQIDFIIYSWIKKSNTNQDLQKTIIYRNNKNLMKNLCISKQGIFYRLYLEKINR